jgi:hypothetical protein
MEDKKRATTAASEGDDSSHRGLFKSKKMGA